MNFRANCICHDEVRVREIVPALGFVVVAFKNTTKFGTSKFAR